MRCWRGRNPGHWDMRSGQQLTRLVYFEELNSENMAMFRFNIISKFTRIQKDRMVRSVNPDWLDLTIGLDFEKILMSGMQISVPMRPPCAAAHQPK